MIYFLAVWRATVLGMLLGSLTRVLIPHDWLLRTLGQSHFQGALLRTTFSLPGMMRTCYAAPVAAGTRKQQVSMGGALAFWMGNPLPSPTTLVFMGFVLGWQFALARLVAGLATVLIVTTLVQKWVREAAAQSVAVPAVPSETARDSFFGRWLRALWTLFWNMIPVYILAVLVLGTVRAWLFPHADGTVGNTSLWVIAVAVTGCLFVVPTAAEIPIVQTMVLTDMGTTPTLALLIILPAVNVPSLVMLHGAFPAKTLWLTGGLVALCRVVVDVLALVQFAVSVWIAD